MTRRRDNRRPRLTILNGCFSGLEIAISKDAVTLGRSVENDICLDHSFVAEQHAVIRRRNGGYTIEDLNTRHGTALNGREIHRQDLKNKDRIRIGNFELRFNR